MGALGVQNFVENGADSNCKYCNAEMAPEEANLLLPLPAETETLFWNTSYEKSSLSSSWETSSVCDSDSNQSDWASVDLTPTLCSLDPQIQHFNRRVKVAPKKREDLYKNVCTSVTDTTVNEEGVILKRFRNKIFTFEKLTCSNDGLLELVIEICYLICHNKHRDIKFKMSALTALYQSVDEYLKAWLEEIGQQQY